MDDDAKALIFSLLVAMKKLTDVVRSTAETEANDRDTINEIYQIINGLHNKIR